MKTRTSSLPCELAEVIYEKPLSGAFEEVSFGSDKGNTLWVKFSDKDGIVEWIGKFSDGGSGSRRVVKITEPDRFFVSAGNFAYIIDATSRQLVSQYCEENVCDITYDVPRKLLIVADYTQLRWVNFEGEILTSKSIGVDGIRDLKIEGRVLSGLAYRDYGDEKEQKFTFNLDKLEILRWEKIPSKITSSKKSWWKFW